MMPCYRKKTHDGFMFICGDLGQHCACCADASDFLCDYPVGEGKTCDAALCELHAHEIAPNLHYCPAHFGEWKRFVESGGVKRVLDNVVPYKPAEPGQGGE